MAGQMDIPGVRPTRAQVPMERLVELSRAIGAILALDKVADELRKAQKEHPTVPGLTLALAVADKHIAQTRQTNSSLVLILACAAGLEIERMATTVEMRDDGGLDVVTFREREGD